MFDIDITHNNITQNSIYDNNSLICSSSNCITIDTSTVRLTRYTNPLTTG
jgi:hypothetical protein